MFSIRPVAESDFAAWRLLWDGYNAFYGRSGATALPEEVVLATWRRFFAADEPVHALVAADGGALGGIAHYIFHRSTTALAPVTYLQDLFTAPAARGQGVASALIEAVYARAHAAGSPRVYWQTHETNQVAMRVYDRLAERSGFVVYRKAIP